MSENPPLILVGWCVPTICLVDHLYCCVTAIVFIVAFCLGSCYCSSFDLAAVGGCTKTSLRRRAKGEGADFLYDCDWNSQATPEAWSNDKRTARGALRDIAKLYVFTQSLFVSSIESASVLSLMAAAWLTECHWPLQFWKEVALAVNFLSITFSLTLCSTSTQCSLLLLSLLQESKRDRVWSYPARTRC